MAPFWDSGYLGHNIISITNFLGRLGSKLLALSFSTCNMRGVGLYISQDRLSYAAVIKNTHITRLETIRIYILLLLLVTIMSHLGSLLPSHHPPQADRAAIT